MINIPPGYTQGIYKEAKAMGTFLTYASAKQLIETEVMKALEGTSDIPYVRSTFEGVVWDNTSDINGVPAATMLKELPPGGFAYLIKVNGIVTVFQPHDPNQAGFIPMSAETAKERGDALAVQLAAEDLLSQLRSHLIEKCILS